jgi:hypothetical protein
VTNRPATFRQADLARALRAAKQAGMDVGGFEIDPSGKIVVRSADVMRQEAPTEDAFEKWKAGRNARSQGH